MNSGPVTIRLEVPEPAPAPAVEAPPHESAHLSEPFSSILEEIASELELRPLLTSIITRACGLLGADDGAIGLYEPRRHVVQIEAVHRLPEAELGTEFEPNEGLVGRVLATGKPVIIEETFPLSCSVESFERFFTGSRDTASGWIGFYWGKTLAEYRAGKEFKDVLMSRWLEFFQAQGPRFR